MPSSMIHLSVAKRINSNTEIDFYIGNLAPDSILDSKKKEENHLRNNPNREIALKEFTSTIDKNNVYLKGIVLHLFVDWKWDTLMMAEFAKKNGDGWFPKYRN